MKTLRLILAILMCGAWSCGRAVAQSPAPATAAKAEGKGANASVDGSAGGKIGGAESAKPERDAAIEEGWTRAFRAGPLGKDRSGRPGERLGQAGPAVGKPFKVQLPSRNLPKMEEFHRLGLGITSAANRTATVPASASHGRESVVVVHSHSPRAPEPGHALKGNAGMATIGGLAFMKPQTLAAINGTTIQHRR